MIRKKLKWLIDYKLVFISCFSNQGRFKEGDVLTYNWKAKISLAPLVAKKPKVRIVKSVKRHKNQDTIYFMCGDLSACFWQRKLFFWEAMKWRKEINNLNKHNNYD